MAEKTETKKAEQTVPAFRKKAIIRSRKYERWADYLNANLKDDKSYTHAELAAMIKKAFKVDVR